MTVWAEGMACRVVEHDESTRKPKPEGRSFAARVDEVAGMYVMVTYDDPGVYRPGRRDAFYADGGWRAWDGQIRWRLLPGTGDKDSHADSPADRNHPALQEGDGNG
jgi:hypothetical protein